MSPDRTALLYERYPAIFPENNRRLKQSLMGSGFACGDGWFDLINELCAALQAGVDRGDFPQVEAIQVNEKFAALRFYFGPYDKAADALIEEAQTRSHSICEVCGAPGVLRGLNHAHHTRCDQHADKGSVIVPKGT